MLTLRLFSDINQRMEEDVRKYSSIDREFSKTQIIRNAEAVEFVLKWFEESKPFDNDRKKELLVSFSTGFISTGDD